MPLPKLITADQLEEIPFKRNVNLFRKSFDVLGKGSSRTVFRVPYKHRETALKVAHNHFGIAQNTEEVKYLTSLKMQSFGVLVPYIDSGQIHGKDYWVQTECTTKMTAAALRQLTGYSSIREMCYDCSASESYDDLKHRTPTSVGLMGMIKAFPEVHVGDLERYCNWGLYKGRPVIIDIGFNSNSEAHQV